MVSPWINRGSTAVQLRALSPHRFSRVSLVLASGERIKTVCLRRSERHEGRLLPWGTVPSAPCPAPPRPAAHRAGRPDPPVVCPSFGPDKSVQTGVRLLVLPKSHPEQPSSISWSPGKQEGWLFPWWTDPSASRLNWPRSASPAGSGFWIRLVPKYALHEKGSKGQKRRRPTAQQPGKKERDSSC